MTVESMAGGTQPFDIVIAGGTIIDGTEDARPTRLDVAVDGDRIAAIGDFTGAPTRLCLDATDAIVAPGFIDPHTHVEPALLHGGPDALAPVAQGVTTCLTAPDGFGWAPLPNADAVSLWASIAGINGSAPDDLPTASVPEYLGRLGSRTACNVLPMAPHMAIRYAGLGWSAHRPSRTEIARMRDVLGEWLSAGAAGLALGLDYEPGARAAEAELTALARDVASVGGVIAAHLRYQDAGRRAAWLELARIGEQAGIPVVIAHETLDDEGLALLEAARRLADVSLETYLYPASSTHLAMFVPAADRIGGAQAISDRLHDPAVAARLAPVIAARIRAEGAAAITFAASSVPSRIGADLLELAGSDGLGSTVIDILRDDPDALFVFRRTVDDDARAAARRTIAHPATMVASDGIYRPGRVHPRGWGTFPRVLRLAVRTWGALDLPAAIHAMTGRTASRYRVPDRGRIALGCAADLVVLDPATVSDGATWDAPRRPPVGIRHVLVNGVPVVRDGALTAARPGRVLAAA